MDPLTPMIRCAILSYYDTFNFSQLLAIVYVRLWCQRRGMLANQLYSNSLAKMHLCQTLLPWIIMRTKAQPSSPQSRVHSARSDNSCSANGFDGVHEIHVPREFVICIQVSRGLLILRIGSCKINTWYLAEGHRSEAPVAVHSAWKPRDPADSFVEIRGSLF
jgi:hypothetical protein